MKHLYYKVGELLRRLFFRLSVVLTLGIREGGNKTILGGFSDEMSRKGDIFMSNKVAHSESKVVGDRCFALISLLVATDQRVALRSIEECAMKFFRDLLSEPTSNVSSKEVDIHD